MSLKHLATVPLMLVIVLSLAAGAAGAGSPGAEGPGPAAAAASPVTAAFTYQGQLKQGSAPVNGPCDFTFALWDAPAGGSQVGPALSRPGVQVTNGLFTVTDLAFADTAFQGDARWLEISVACPTGSGALIVLEPRQPLTAAPYALGLRPGARVSGDVTSGTVVEPQAVLTLENTNTNPSYRASGLYAKSWSPGGAAVWGQSSTGAGGRFNSESGHALIADRPALIAGLNPAQIGMLKWYAGASPNHVLPVASTPDQIAFDGEHIWVTNYGAGKVTKIHPSSGAVIGEYDAVPNPNPIAFDGWYLYVGSESTPDVAVIRARDGGLEHTLKGLPSGHWGMAFDGKHMWIANTGADSISKVRVSDNAVLATYPTGDVPTGVAFDGRFIWVANNGSDNVTRIEADTGYTTTYPVGDGPSGVAFDGANIWVANGASGTLSKLRASDGASLGTSGPCSSPIWLAFDGFHLWVTCYQNPGFVVKVRATDGMSIATFQVGDYPIGVAFDGTHVWVASTGIVSNFGYVSKH